MMVILSIKNELTKIWRLKTDRRELKRLRKDVESDINELSNKVKGINGNPLISILPLLATSFCPGFGLGKYAFS